MRPRLRVDAASLLVLAFFVYFSDGRFLAALLPAVAAHEAGHLLALKLLGRRVRGIALEPTGLRIDCAGAADPRGEALAALAGPAAGLCWAWAASRLGARLESEILLLSAGLSLLLSLFNLLPAPPLDGGLAVSALCSLRPGGERGERLAKRLALLCAALLTLAGLWLAWRGRGAAALLAGALLLIRNFRDAGASGYAGCRPRGILRRPAGSRAFHRERGRTPAPRRK